MSTSPLELTPREKRVFEKYREISTTATTAATRMKLVTDADKSRLVPDHGDEFIGKLLLADALGAADLDFSDGLILQLANAGHRAKPCMSPAVSGKKRCRMYGGAPGSGAPIENQNALKSGLFTREAKSAVRCET